MICYFICSLEAGDISGSLGNIWSNKPVSNFKTKLLYKLENYTKKKKKSSEKVMKLNQMRVS